MTKLQKIVLGIVGIVAALGLFLPTPAGQALGGMIHTLQEDFTQGIRVAGTEVISKARAITAASLTVTGATTIGSSNAGLSFFSPVLAPAADTTLTAAQSGSIIKMNTAGQDMTLPTASAAIGAHYRFVVTAAVATTNMTIVAAPADTFEGTLIVAGAVVDCDAGDVLTFVIDGENIGDFVEVYSDGTSWLIGESGVLTASKLTCSG